MGNIVAIDGGAYTGTSSLAKSLAKVFVLSNLNTGSMYRGVTAVALALGVDPTDAAACEGVARTLTFGYCEGVVCSANDTWAEKDYDLRELIWSEVVSGAVSQVSVHPGVRLILVRKQRKIAVHSDENYVIEGRDIGTSVAPQARLKLFLTASERSRAKRMKDSGRFGSIKNIRDRDRIDSERAVDPMRPSDDAVVLDTTNLRQPEVLAVAAAIMDLRGFTRRIT